MYLWPQEAYISNFFMATEVMAALEVVIDLKIELRDLNYTCSTPLWSQRSLYELIDTRRNCSP